MNHTCLGDIFERWDKKWGRCFADSSIFEIRQGMEYCPACGRPWDGSAGKKEDFEPDACDVVLREIDVPQFKFMLEEKSRKVKQLEEELEHWKKMYFEKTGIVGSPR